MSDRICYTIGLNFVTSSNQYFPCGGGSDDGVQSCCYAGDYCMEDSICQYTHSVANGTGFYMAGCTDPTWQDPTCPKQCTSEYGADIIYDTTNDQWNCCVSEEGYLNCQQPSDFIVQAPAPSQLETLTQLNTPAPSASLTGVGSVSSFLGTISTSAAGSSSSSATTSSAEISQSSSSTSQNTLASATSTHNASVSAAPSSSDAGLSSGAIAGIVIGVIAGLAILAIGALFLFRWNKRNSAAIKQHEWSGAHPGQDSGRTEMYAHMADKPANYEGQGSQDGFAGHGAPQYYELQSPDKDMRPQELMGDPGRGPAELGDGRKSAMR